MGDPKDNINDEDGKEVEMVVRGIKQKKEEWAKR